MRRHILFYTSIILVFGASIIFTLKLGENISPNQTSLSQGRAPAPTSAAAPTPRAQSDDSRGRVEQAQDKRNHLSVLLLQVIIILAAARLVGALFRKLGQPSVIGEMVAGILLGPSLLGWLSPAGMSFIFPPSAMEPLWLLGQVGIILFMFTVGIELDFDQLRQKAHSVILVSHTSILVPFLLGVAISLFIFRSFAPPNISFSAFAMFLGVAMSLTAFPVLARIIKERGLSNSHLGSTALACAAVDDATAWCLLAAVIGIVNAQGMNSAILTGAAVLLYVVVMFVFVRKRAGRYTFEALKQESRRKAIVAALLVYLCASALITEAIGIHALFGAFVAGVVLPSNSSLRVFVVERLEILTESFFLPLFFAFTGLRTQIGLLNDWASWAVCLAIIAVAIAGKVGGSTLAARWTGMDWRDSLSLGVLMNTRGLIELIVLNIGYDLGILSPQVFSMMVLMALVTTLMAGPLLSLIASLKGSEAAPRRERDLPSLVKPEAIPMLGVGNVNAE